ncbi:type II toxin-antitoxin system Phd/YefM family antitoxin [Micromonospora carbonacea]|uniref:type II toxin-antitoxin system Phd/YefM family antitoxin n=1 Tax=Micromonospora carbonacea TaxID=47853 RepID=UPI00371F5A67
MVIVPLAVYEAMKETEHLLRSPSNSAALRRSIVELEAGDAQRTRGNRQAGARRDRRLPLRLR